MSDQEQLEMLFERWEESFEQGKPSAPDDLCEGCEHLLPQLVRRIQAYQAMEGLRKNVGLHASTTPETASFDGQIRHETAETASQIHASSPVALGFLQRRDGPQELGWFGEDYRVLQVLGQGGMGLVLEVENVRLSRREALKLIRPDRINSQTRQRFLREAQALALVHHRNVVPIYHVGEMGELPFLTMPLLRGQSLQDRLRPGSALPISKVIRIGEQIALGLAAAHSKGLVHRDLKLGNIWLGHVAEEDDSESERALLLDFGLARPVEEDKGITGEGIVPGTLRYLSPEQANGQELDGRSDLFSLGIVLYEMVTGEAPFQGKTTLEILSQIANHVPPSPEELRREVPEGLSQLVKALLTKDREQRPSSAREVADQLKQSHTSQTTEDHQQPQRTQPSTRKRSRLLVAGLVGAVLLGVGLLWSLRFLPFAAEGDPTPPEEKPPLARPTKPFKGWLDVVISNKNVPGRRRLFLDELGTLPLRPQDQWSVKTKLNLEAYLYLILIDTEGNAFPVYPWTPGDWKSSRESEPRDSLRLPKNLDKNWEIPKTTPGMLTLVLFAREEPLPAEVDLQSKLSGLPTWKGLKEDRSTEMVWFENGRRTDNRRSRSGFFKEVGTADPVLVIQERVRRLQQDEKLFDYSLAVSYGIRDR